MASKTMLRSPSLSTVFSISDDDDIKINAPELEGKYRIIGKIDHGGYAIVYKAIDLNASNRNNIVAIKRVHAANIKDNFSNHTPIEVKILHQFRGNKYFPKLQQVLVDKSSGCFSIIMNYFEHQIFSEYNTILNEYDTIKYIHILLSCIAKLSEKGYVHRDIKPANFLYNHQTKQYLLIDFGLCQLKTSILTKYQKEIKLFNQYNNKHNKLKINKSRRHSTMTTTTTKSKKLKSTNKHKKTRRSDVFIGNMRNNTLPICIRDGTPGWRAPEVIFASNNQDSRIDIYNVGLILGCIMMGSNLIFTPKNDYHQLIQFINLYGLNTVLETAEEMDRKIAIRGLTRESIYMNNGDDHFIDSTGYITGYETATQYRSLSYWIRKYLKKNQQKHNNNNNNNNNNIDDMQYHREWSDDLYDLLDRLTEFNPFKRLTVTKALQHKVFSSL